MSIAGNLVVVIIALLHVYFLVLEMFLWTKPAGRRAFGLTAECWWPASSEGSRQAGKFCGFRHSRR